MGGRNTTREVEKSVKCLYVILMDAPLYVIRFSSSQKDSQFATLYQILPVHYSGINEQSQNPHQKNNTNWSQR